MSDPGKTRLCDLEDIPDGEAREFGEPSAEGLFAVRQGETVHVYRNCCPHAGTPLNWMPDRFLTRDKSEIICSTHGARFEIATGECTDGPCPGEYLTRIPCVVSGGEVWIKQ